MIQDILQSINKLLAMDSADDAEKDQFITNSRDPEVRRLSGKLSTRDVLIVAEVAKAAPFPQKALGEKINSSQPTISRAVSHLTKLGLLTRMRIPTNKKEWQLAPTDLGHKIAKGKKALDKGMNSEAAKIASHYTEEELARFNEFINEIIALKQQ